MSGRTEAPVALEFAIEREWFFDRRTGELLDATVTRAGRAPLKIGDSVVEATPYEIVGDLERHVWFDAGGAWVQWRLWRQGLLVLITHGREAWLAGPMEKPSRGRAWTRSPAMPHCRRERRPRGSTMPRPTGSALVLLGLLLAGCASAPTPYQAAQGGFGYSEQQIEENRYRVSFAGNSATSRQTVEDYLLYRAAELTVQTGHDWFQVVDRNTVQEYSGRGGSPEMGVGVGSGGDFGVGLSFPVLGGGGGAGRYTGSMDVVVRDGEKPQEDANAYDAFSVISRLQPKVLAGGS